MTFIISLQVEEDLIQTYLYGLETFGELQVERYFNTLEKSFDRITQNPEMYTIANEIKTGYRFCVPNSHSIFFTSEEQVNII